MDSGASYHLTPDLDNLSHRQEYHGPDDVTISNGNTLSISHVGSSSPTIKNRNFHLHNIFHVPAVCTNLLSVSSFTNTNNVSIEFFPSYFHIKDIPTRTLLHTGPNNGGIYTLNMTNIPASSKPSSAFLCSLSTWHARLAYASIRTVRQALSQSHIKSSDNNFSLCHACSVSKSHKLPFVRSSFQVS